MDLRAGLVQYAIAVVVFCVLDYVWLKFVAASLYRDLLGDLLADKPRVGAAVLFYAIFLLGLVVFVIHPAAEQDSMTRALLLGAFFGLVTYATWDLTNLATIRDFPVRLVPIDMAWGTALSAAVSGATLLVWRLLPHG
jgi:uncharacterized membrane protein